MAYRAPSAAALAAVLVIAVLASARPTLTSAAPVRPTDAVMVSELHRAMVYLEDYKFRFGSYPVTTRQLTAGTGFRLTPGIRWKAFRTRATPKDRTRSVFMAIGLPGSATVWRADYPVEGTRVTAP